MARTIECGEHALTVHLTGLTSIAAFKRTIVIPYQSIVKVDTEPPDLQSLIRLGGTSIGDIHEGHFWHGDSWYFLSYEHADKVVSLNLRDFYVGHRQYEVIALGVDNPQEMKSVIEEKLGNVHS